MNYPTEEGTAVGEYGWAKQAVSQAKWGSHVGTFGRPDRYGRLINERNLVSALHLTQLGVIILC